MPPNSALLTSVVRAPRSAARIAASTPAGPAPITTTSITCAAPHPRVVLRASSPPDGETGRSGSGSPSTSSSHRPPVPLLAPVQAIGQCAPATSPTRRAKSMSGSSSARTGSGGWRYGKRWDAGAVARSAPSLTRLSRSPAAGGAGARRSRPRTPHLDRRAAGRSSSARDGPAAPDWETHRDRRCRRPVRRSHGSGELV